MNTVSTSITLRKATLEYAKNIAKKKQITVSRFIDNIIYKLLESDTEWNEINREVDDLKKRIDNGTAKVYGSVEEMLKSLKE